MATLDIRVAASSDDCHVSRIVGTWALNLIYTNQMCGYYGPNDDKNGGGMRFLNITIPNAATITTAYLIFKSNGGYAATVVNSRITGEDVDDAATFSNIADYQARRGTIVGGANDNFITTAQVDWDAIPAWVNNQEDADTTSPEIKTIIQEIVDRGGWASGQAMVLFWDDHDDRSDHNGNKNTRRSAHPYDDSPSECSKLHIEYVAVGRSFGYIIG